jgi:hypothetical protein
VFCSAFLFASTAATSIRNQKQLQQTAETALDGENSNINTFNQQLLWPLQLVACKSMQRLRRKNGLQILFAGPVTPARYGLFGAKQTDRYKCSFPAESDRKW